MRSHDKEKRYQKDTLNFVYCMATYGHYRLCFGNHFHRPLFCINLTPDEHYEKYVGLGYSFDIVDKSKEFFKIDAYKGYILGKEICSNLSFSLTN